MGPVRPGPHRQPPGHVRLHRHRRRVGARPLLPVPVGGVRRRRRGGAAAAAGAAARRAARHNFRGRAGADARVALATSRRSRGGGGHKKQKKKLKAATGAGFSKSAAARCRRRCAPVASERRGDCRAQSEQPDAVCSADSNRAAAFKGRRGGAIRAGSTISERQIGRSSTERRAVRDKRNLLPACISAPDLPVTRSSIARLIALTPSGFEIVPSVAAHRLDARRVMCAAARWPAGFHGRYVHVPTRIARAGNTTAPSARNTLIAHETCENDSRYVYSKRCGRERPDCRSAVRANRERQMAE